MRADTIHGRDVLPWEGTADPPRYLNQSRAAPTGDNRFDSCLDHSITHPKDDPPWRPCCARRRVMENPVCPECGDDVPEPGLCWGCFDEAELFELCVEANLEDS